MIYEDNHLLVIDKPCGLITMGAPLGRPSAVQRAAEYLKQRYNKPGNVYVGVVSRLDSLVSGVLVLARTSKAASRLSDQIRQHSTTKRYVAIVEGAVQIGDSKLSDAFVEIRHHLRKNEALHRMQSFSRPVDDSKVAVMKLRKMDNWREHSLVEVQLITGRKHQIRLQLSSLGNPIMGDAKYGAKTAWPQGIALHCFEVTVQHPTKREMLTFRAFPDHWRPTLGHDIYHRFNRHLASSASPSNIAQNYRSNSHCPTNSQPDPE